jgi:phosphoribosyl 1,2-cyclic phosphodiesterase
MNDDRLSIRFWGVRGSIPAPGPDTAVVGGNTSCVEINGGGTRLVLDAGSGLRLLGDEMMTRGAHREQPVHLLLSHVHWDHVMGLPFFTPLYVPGTEIHVATGPSGAPLRDLLRRQMSAPMFPVDLERAAAKLVTHDLVDGQRLRVGALEVEVARLNHPDPVYGYRIEHGGRSVVYATDTEHYACVDPRLLRLARGADLLIYDAQYTPEEYRGEVGMAKVGWGHSTFAAGAEIAAAAGVQKLCLFHHDPRRTDEGVAALLRRARELFPETVAAREGLTLELPVRGGARDAA